MIPRTLEPTPPELPSTGIDGFDTPLLRGGLPRDDMHLLQGTAGTGKTTIALEFLLAGAAAGEATLYITLAQSKAGLLRIARSHGWSLDAITIHELSPADLMGRAQ